MKKVLGVLLFSCSFFVLTGCERGSSNVGADAEQSAVEAYEANLAASEKDLGAAGVSEEE